MQVTEACFNILRKMKQNSISLTNIFAILIVVLPALAVTGCARWGGYEAETIRGVVWGTEYAVTYPKDSCRDADAVVLNALASVDSVANAFSPVSEISRLNAAGVLRNPSQKFLAVYEASRRLNAATDGAFDPTIGPLVDMWGFGAGRQVENIDSLTVDSVLRSVDMTKVVLDGNVVRFTGEGMRLDWGAIAKGYGVDCVAEGLKANGISNYMVEIGGEVRVSGVNPRGDAWTVQIDAPVPDVTGNHRRLMVVGMTDAAVATSGNYRNFRRDENGNLLFHTISPVTGRPVQTEVLSATVFARDCMTADALATASMVKGLENAEKMIERLVGQAGSGVLGAIFVTQDKDSPDSFEVRIVALNTRYVSVLSGERR